MSTESAMPPTIWFSRRAAPASLHALLRDSDATTILVVAAAPDIACAVAALAPTAAIRCVASAAPAERETVDLVIEVVDSWADHPPRPWAAMPSQVAALFERASSFGRFMGQPRFLQEAI